jgi:peroxiredoxin
MRQQLLVPALLAGALILGSWGLNRLMQDEPTTVAVPQAPQAPRQAPQPQPQADNNEAPDFNLTEVLSKADIKLSDYRGKVVLIDFWATWCRPCRMEIPHFVDLKKELSEDDFELIGISVDRKGEAVVIPFVKQWKINYPTVIDTGGTVSTQYGGIRSIPTAFLIGRDGKIINRFVGYKPKNVFEQAIKQAIKKS